VYLNAVIKRHYFLATLYIVTALLLQNRAANPLHIDMRLNIELTDVNDEMPLFGGLDENGRYSGSIAENLDSGAEFITVTATDKDEFPDFKKVTDQNAENWFTVR